MKKTSLLLAGILALTVPAFSQTQPGSAGTSAPALTDLESRSLAVQRKVRQIELLSMFLPLTLTKSQLNPILLTLEKIRADQKRVLKAEDEAIVKLEAATDELYKKGAEELVYPDREKFRSVSKTMEALAMARNVAAGEFVTRVRETLDKTLNKGQKAALIGSIPPDRLKPGAKEGEVSDQARMDAFIRAFVLDPLAYDVLVALQKKVD